MTLQYSEINFDNNINDKNNLKLPDPPKLTQNKEVITRLKKVKIMI
jgi:hypothetical protein